MSRTRLEGLTDAVTAILITIMVLEFKVPVATDWTDLLPLIPSFLAYVLSFVNLAIYWNNHHHMFHLVQHVNGKILWANLHLLFWISLIPFTTEWLGRSGFTLVPVFIYGAVLFFGGLAYYILQMTIIASQGDGSRLKQAIGSDLKGKGSLVLYFVALPLVFVDDRIPLALYVLVTLIWLVPDRRIESKVKQL